LLAKLLGAQHAPHTWRTHSYRGVGRIPPKLQPSGDPAKRILLDQLPRLLRGYGQSPGIDAVVVVLDSDRRDCTAFLAELQQMLRRCGKVPLTMFHLAIEEIEAWYFGDQQAVLEAYPKARRDVLKKYKQDSVCQTWEHLANAIYPGGAKAIQQAGWPLPGQVKHEWAERIAPLLDPDRNRSPSFGKLRDGLRKLGNPRK
jgi:hypothetical protein